MNTIQKNTAGGNSKLKQCDSKSVDPSSDQKGLVVVNDPGKTGFRTKVGSLIYSLLLLDECHKN